VLSATAMKYWIVGRSSRHCRLLVSRPAKPCSRGSANTYAVAAIDAGRGGRCFSLVVASSGGVALDCPPNLALLRGDCRTRWVTPP